jgi:hypothetical protein
MRVSSVHEPAMNRSGQVARSLHGVHILHALGNKSLIYLLVCVNCLSRLTKCLNVHAHTQVHLLWQTHVFKKGVHTSRQPKVRCRDGTRTLPVHRAARTQTCDVRLPNIAGKYQMPTAYIRELSNFTDSRTSF